jgi:hypothetical protein
VASLAEWKSKLETLKQSVSSRASASAKIMGQIGAWLSRYHGGMPLGFLAAIVQFESGGNPNAGGDAGLGEHGYLQVAASTAQTFGLPPATRLQPEANIFLGALEYQLEAIKMHLALPAAVRLGTPDSWKLARLAFAIGSPGTRKLLAAGVPSTSSTPWADLLAYLDRVGGVALGSQEAGKVWYRAHAVDVLWTIGQAVDPAQSVGPPTRLPAPAGLAYTLPPSAAPYFSEPSSGLLLAVVLAAGAAALLLA